LIICCISGAVKALSPCATGCFGWKVISLKQSWLSSQAVTNASRSCPVFGRGMITRAAVAAAAHHVLGVAAVGRPRQMVEVADHHRDVAARQALAVVPCDGVE